MSRFFSLVTPAEGRERDAAHEWARAAYEDHQWLWHFFPAPAGSARDFLFRRRDGDGMPRYYVVSARPPEVPSAAWQAQTRAYAPRLHAGMRLAFDLRANPVTTLRSATGRAVRHDVVMHEKKRLLGEQGLARWKDWPAAERPALPDLIRDTCGAWLRERAERLGCVFDDDVLMVEGYAQQRGKNDDLRFSSVDFSGELTVTDATAFTAALMLGVGHAKAFGCGLLLVKPLR